MNFILYDIFQLSVQVSLSEILGLQKINELIKNNQTIYDMFGDICDEIAIENITTANSEVDYSDIFSEDNKLIVTGEHEINRVHVCPYPFYMLTINADGNVSACCKAIDKAFFIGDAEQEPLNEIWNNKKINELRVFQLKHTRFKHGICRSCDSLDYAVPASDLLDDQAEQLIGHYINN